MQLPLATQVTKEEVVQNLRRQSKGYQKTSSQFRGVTRHQKGKWEARIGQMIGKKYKCAQPHPLSCACIATCARTLLHRPQNGVWQCCADQICEEHI